jgi:hypothetical protein
MCSERVREGEGQEEKVTEEDEEDDNDDEERDQIRGGWRMKRGRGASDRGRVGEGKRNEEERDGDIEGGTLVPAGRQR